MTDDRTTLGEDTGAVSAAALLLERIEAFGFNEPCDPLGFESRLPDDQGWTPGYALAVVAEYQRFLVSTQVMGHAASPSPDVDEAWHLHLTRTAHLWRANARSERVLRPLRLAVGQYRKTTPVGPALAFGVALVGGTVLADDLRFEGLKQQVDAGALAMVTRRAGKGKGDGDDGSCSACGSCGSDGGSSCSSGGSCSSGCAGGGDRDRRRKRSAHGVLLARRRNRHAAERQVVTRTF